MAQLAGLELESRLADGDGTPFDASSERHVYVWRKVEWQGGSNSAAERRVSRGVGSGYGPRLWSAAEPGDDGLATGPARHQRRTSSCVAQVAHDPHRPAFR